MNISSVIVHARPGFAEIVAARLRVVAGIEIHGVSDEGKMVVTIETDGDQATTDTFELITKMDDVLSASLVFHQTESHPEMGISVSA